MIYEAVVFDMDGTLLNTLTDIGKATNRVLAARNYPTHPLKDYQYFVGAGIVRLMKCVLPEEAQTETMIKECIEEFTLDYKNSWQENTKPYDGVVEMLNALSKLGLRLAILSNKPHDLTQFSVKEMLADWPFEMVLGQRDHIPRKPDPAGALEIAKKMDIPSAHILYLGDTGIDMETAVNAGMFPIGVLWGFRPREELLQAGAKVLIESPLELLDFLQQNSLF